MKSRHKHDYFQPLRLNLSKVSEEEEEEDLTHSINNWDAATEVVPWYSAYQVPLYKPIASTGFNKLGILKHVPYSWAGLHFLYCRPAQKHRACWSNPTSAKTMLAKSNYGHMMTLGTLNTMALFIYNIPVIVEPGWHFFDRYDNNQLPLALDAGA